MEKSTRALLEANYNDYVTSISTPGAACSFETTCYLWELCDNLRPKVLMDTGSGWSSYVLRLWSMRNENQRVWSFDDNEGWLKASVNFCERHGTPTSKFVLWNDENVKRVIDADIVFHDLGNRFVRGDTLGSLLTALSPHGVILLDDMHKGDYRERVERFISVNDLVCEDVSEQTRDVFGRFCWLVKRKPTEQRPL